MTIRKNTNFADPEHRLRPPWDTLGSARSVDRWTSTAPSAVAAPRSTPLIRQLLGGHLSCQKNQGITKEAPGVHQGSTQNHQCSPRFTSVHPESPVGNREPSRCLLSFTPSHQLNASKASPPEGHPAGGHDSMSTLHLDRFSDGGPPAVTNGRLVAP